MLKVFMRGRRLSDKMDVATMMSNMLLFWGRSHRQQEKPAGIAMTPFQQTVSKNISRLLAKHVKTIHLLVKTSHMLRPVKYNLGVKVTVCLVSVVKSMLGRLTDPWKPDVRNIWDMYVWASQNVHCGGAQIWKKDNINFNTFSILDKATGYMDCVIKEVI